MASDGGILQLMVSRGGRMIGIEHWCSSTSPASQHLPTASAAEQPRHACHAPTATRVTPHTPPSHTTPHPLAPPPRVSRAGVLGGRAFYKDKVWLPGKVQPHQRIWSHDYSGEGGAALWWCMERS